MPRLPLRGSPFLTAPLLFPGGLASAGEIGVPAGIADRVQQRLAAATSETPERGPGQADTRVDQAPASQLGGCRRVDVAGDRRLCPAPARTAAGHRSPAPLGESGSAEQAHAHPVRREFRNLRTKTGSPASAPKPSRPGPGPAAGFEKRPPVMTGAESLPPARRTAAPPTTRRHQTPCAPRNGKLDGLGRVQRA
jgi:hypothetical protein